MDTPRESAAPAADAPFFIVINAGSGRHDSADSERTIADVLGTGGRRHYFLRVADPAQLGDVIDDAVGRARAEGGIVVAAGGDGTLSAVARAVLASGLPFAVLPQGTFNMFGRAHGISQDLVESTRSLLHARIAPVEVGRLNGRVFLVNASLGLYPELLERREDDKERLGRSRIVAFWSGLKTLLRGHDELLLDIDGGAGSRSVRTSTLFVGNNRMQLERIGVDDPDAGRLAGIFVRPIGGLAMLWLALRGALGRLGDAANVEVFAFRRITVTPRGQRRCKVAIDGEIVWLESPLVFDVSPQPLRLLQPAAADRVAIG